MSDYTNSTEHIRSVYALSSIPAVRPQARAHFDRWLAEHTRGVQEAAWQEGYGSDEECGMPRDNPYRKNADGR